MTLAEGKKKVLMLLDEYSTGGEITTDSDIDAKMNRFFDMAQKDIAQKQPIIKKYVLTATTDYAAVPANYIRTYRVWQDGEQHTKFPVIDGFFYIGDDTGTYTIEYLKYPDTIDASTEDTEEFEVNEYAANCMPYYVAAQQIITDLVVDYSAFWSMYLQMKQNLEEIMPELGGSVQVRQRLFGG